MIGIVLTMLCFLLAEFPGQAGKLEKFKDGEMPPLLVILMLAVPVALFLIAFGIGGYMVLGIGHSFMAWMLTIFGLYSLCEFFYRWGSMEDENPFLEIPLGNFWPNLFLIVSFILVGMFMTVIGMLTFQETGVGAKIGGSLLILLGFVMAYVNTMASEVDRRKITTVPFELSIFIFRAGAVLSVVGYAWLCSGYLPAVAMGIIVTGIGILNVPGIFNIIDEWKFQHLPEDEQKNQSVYGLDRKGT